MNESVLYWDLPCSILEAVLQELCLLVLDGFDDEFIIAGQVEERAAGARIRQLNQGLFTNRVLQDYNKNNPLKQHIMSL